MTKSFNLFILAVSIFTTSLSSLNADAQSDRYLEQLNQTLQNKTMHKFIAEKQVLQILELAKDEDLNAEYKNYYLMSDSLLLLIKKNGVLDSDFSNIIDAFQLHIDNLKSDQEKLLAIANWKSLWLDKVSAYQVYLKSLKHVFTFDVTQDFNYDSNISLENSDDTFSGAGDGGATLAAGLNYRPFINTKKSRDWSYTMRLSDRANYQMDEEDLQYNYLTWSNTLVYKNLTQKISTVSFGLSGTFGFNIGDTNPRYEYSQWVLNSNIAFLPFNASKLSFGHYQSGINVASIRMRYKSEYDDLSASPVIAEDEATIFTLTYGHVLARHVKNKPAQTLGWNVSLEEQQLDNDSTRDYRFYQLSSFYQRQLNKLSDKYDLSWTLNGSIRFKDWQDSVAGTREDENEFVIGTGLNSNWTKNFSSSFDITYRKRDQSYNTGTDKDIDQWRIVLSNTFISL